MYVYTYIYIYGGFSFVLVQAGPVPQTAPQPRDNSGVHLVMMGFGFLAGFWLLLPGLGSPGLLFIQDSG